MREQNVQITPKKPALKKLYDDVHGNIQFEKAITPANFQYFSYTHDFQSFTFFSFQAK